jgi:hypothetical protein
MLVLGTEYGIRIGTFPTISSVRQVCRADGETFALLIGLAVCLKIFARGGVIERSF